MRIGLQAWGSEGDCRPMLALAAGLHRAGHDVRLLVTNVEGKSWGPRGAELGVPVEDVAVDWFVANSQINDRLMRDIMAASGNPLRQMCLTLQGLLLPVEERMLAAAQRLCAESDLVIGHGWAEPLAVAAHKAKRRYLSLVTTPSVASSHLDPVGLPALGKRLRPVMWAFTRWALNRYFLPLLGGLRAREGLPAIEDGLGWLAGTGEPNLISCSPTFFPPPSDWPARHGMCGFLDLPSGGEGEALPEPMERFLLAGDPPVYLTFGSMFTIGQAPERIEASVRILIEAVRLADVRAIVQAPWKSIGVVPESPSVLRWTEPVPYGRIFPRCAAVVHHCGAGTTHQACRAGKPSIGVPFLLDNPFWAGALHRAGLAPAPIPRNRLTAPKLARAIREALEDARMAEAAAKMGEKMRTEDAVGTAVRIIEGAF